MTLIIFLEFTAWDETGTPDSLRVSTVRSLGGWEDYSEGGAVGGLGVYLDASAVGFHESLADGEAEAGALLFGGDEGDEEALQVVGDYAAAGVA